MQVVKKLADLTHRWLLTRNELVASKLRDTRHDRKFSMSQSSWRTGGQLHNQFLTWALVSGKCNSLDDTLHRHLPWRPLTTNLPLFESHVKVFGENSRCRLFVAVVVTGNHTPPCVLTKCRKVRLSFLTAKCVAVSLKHCRCHGEGSRNTQASDIW